MDIYIDGSSIGNPGEASIGIVFQEGDTTVKNISRRIGIQTDFIQYYLPIMIKFFSKDGARKEPIRQP